MRKWSWSTFPLSGMFCLNIKSSSDSIFFNINVERSSFHWNGDIFCSMSWSPMIIKLRINMMMLIMKWKPEIVRIYLIYLLLELISDGFNSHNIVEHFLKVFLIIICCIWWINSSNVERFTWILVPCHLVIIKKIITIRRTIFYCNLFGKRYHIAETKSSSWAISCYDWCCFTPVKSDVNFNSSTKNYDCVIAQDVCLLFWIPIEKFGFCVVDKIGYSRGVEGYVTNFFDILLKMCEGAVKFILFSKSILTHKIKVTSITFNSKILIRTIYFLILVLYCFDRESVCDE